MGAAGPSGGAGAPPASVLRAFGVAGGEPVRLPGGQGSSWRAGGTEDAVVLKPVRDELEAAEVRWLSEVLSTVSGDGFRLAAPVPSSHGEWVVDGWRADRWVAGREGPAGRWREVLDASAAFCAAAARVDRPTFLEERRHPWARADRAAWDELDLDVPADVQPLVGRLRDLTAPPRQAPQLVHGDVAGNTLFHPGLPPAVIDVSPYWRPAPYAGAVAVADALLWWHEGPGLLAAAGEAGDPALVARALLFRLLTDVQPLREADRRASPGASPQPYEDAVAELERQVR